VQIDWVTVAAQIVNFLVLVWLLQRVLYRPLTRALKEREEEVKRSLREAESARERPRKPKLRRTVMHSKCWRMSDTPASRQWRRRRKLAAK
jgi:flagellar biosynthesis/type III secretory pathway M-ring protein FliF/YscJ